MTAWQILKSEMIKGTQPNTCGYQVAVGTAAMIFITLKDHLKNWKEEEKVFNADAEVTTAIINRKSFFELGLCKT